jgi:hypothetical protein
MFKRNLIARYLYYFNHINIEAISAASLNLIHLLPRRKDGHTDGRTGASQ